MSTLTTPLITHTPTRAPAAPIEETRWRIDPARSRVGFRTRSLWGLVTVEGEFSDYRGTLELDRDPAIELTLDAASLDTGNTLRDKHLRGGDFFDVTRHPEVRFTSETATLDGERLHVTGRLEAGGRSIPLKLEGTLRPVGDELELDASVLADHERLGMSSGLLGMIRTPSELIVRGRLVR
jgi:polyisoprenoid-binding protein YceI